MQTIGLAQPNLSLFLSIEIPDTVWQPAVRFQPGSYQHYAVAWIDFVFG
jgi:hypothetical protein